MASFRVLIPVDGSEFSRRALTSVRTFLNPETFSLTLLRVAPVPASIKGDPPRPLVVDGWIELTYDSERNRDLAKHPIFDSQVWESLRFELVDEMAEDMRALEEAGFAVSLVVRFGDPAEEITAFAREEGVDLVIMATHGRSGLQRAVMGSVAEKVLHNASVPVIMVPPVRAPAPKPLPFADLVEE
jgi:nucleotide-binding universal stress UspA family protein